MKHLERGAERGWEGVTRRGEFVRRALNNGGASFVAQEEVRDEFVREREERDEFVRRALNKGGGSSLRGRFVGEGNS